MEPSAFKNKAAVPSPRKWELLSEVGPELGPNELALKIASVHLRESSLLLGQREPNRLHRHRCLCAQIPRGHGDHERLFGDDRRKIQSVWSREIPQRASPS